MGGRRKDRELYWRGVLERQAVSGLNIASFCREESISTPSFYNWRLKLRERDAAAGGENHRVDAQSNSGAQLHPERIESSESPASVRILLPQGVSVETSSSVSSSVLADVLRALREAAIC